MSPALRLLAACCRWPANDARARAVATAAADIEDWDEVVRSAARHRVEPLVVNGLEAAGLAVPPSIMGAMMPLRRAAIRDLGETLRIAASLDTAGIPHRFLKGTPLGVAAFGNALLKRSWDIDLLVRPEQAVAAAACLGDQGYQPLTPPRPFDFAEFQRWSVASIEAQFRSPAGTVVELHWAVTGQPHLLPRIAADGHCRIVTLLGEHGVATLADDANLAYLAVHGSSHAWFRLKWLADFHALLQSIEPPDRSAALARAHAFGVGHALDTAVTLSRLLFEDLRPPPPLHRLVRLSLRALEDDEQAATKLAAQAQMQLDSRLAYRLTEAAKRLRGSEDRLHFPLPRHWQFLYPLLRAPFWLFRRFRGRQKG